VPLVHTGSWSGVDQKGVGVSSEADGMFFQGNSAKELRHPRSVAYSVEFVLLKKQQFSGGAACLHCYQSSSGTVHIHALTLM